MNGPLASYAMVRVRVLDVNDVEPQFTSKIYKLKAREDLPLGTVIGSVQALDPDLYQGGNVKVSKIPKYSAKLFHHMVSLVPYYPTSWCFSTKLYHQAAI